jgi:hypothetical protein
LPIEDSTIGKIDARQGGDRRDSLISASDA